MSAKPTIISATPSYACNIRCVHCYQEPSRTKDLNNPSLFDQIKELAPTLSHITCGGGEPFLLPIWQKFLASVDLNENPYLTFATCTNATLLPAAALARIEQFKRVQVGVSMDAGTKDVYERVRLRSNFDTVDKNVDRLIEVVRSKPGSYVSMSMSVMRDNVEDMVNFFRYATSKGSRCGLSPVMAMPADQAITCFSDPTIDLPRWRAALDNAEEAVRTLDLGAITDLPEVVKADYLGQIQFVRDQIPWSLADLPHVLVDGEVPESLRGASDSDRKLGDPLAVFYPLDANAAVPRYFSPLRDGRFSVAMAPGSYRVGVIRRFEWPRFEPNWLFHVSGNELASFQRSLAGGHILGVIAWGEPISGGDLAPYFAINAYQENTNTWMSSQTGPDVIGSAYLGIDLGSEVLPDVGAVQVQWALDYCTPGSVALQSSDDGLLWDTDSDHQIDASDATRTFWWQSLKVLRPKPHRFWRIVPLSEAKNSGPVAVGQIRFLTT